MKEHLPVDRVPTQPITADVAARNNRYALVLLFVIFAFNFLDRQIVNILAEPIKRELGLADWQLGTLTGLSFALFYATLALPIARLAEFGDRARIISACVVIWSLFTALCGLATNFVMLLMARIGVGVGEAGCTPTSHSLITDYVPKERRASALAFYSLGIPVGSLVGLAFGGLLADSYGWRVAFFAAGMPGVLLGILAYLTLPEPRRDVSGKVVSSLTPSLREAIAEIGTKKSFWWITLGSSLTTFFGFGQLAFYGSFFLRNHAPRLEEMATHAEHALGVAFGTTGFLGVVLGLLIGAFGAFGTWLGGAVADRAISRDIRGYVWIPAIAALGALPPFIAAMLVGDAAVALLLLVLPTICGAIWYGPVFACIQGLVVARSRATAAAVFFFCINLVGLGLGPLTVGALSDYFAMVHGEAEGLRRALISVSSIGILSAGAYGAAARSLRKDFTG